MIPTAGRGTSRWFPATLPSRRREAFPAPLFDFQALAHIQGVFHPHPVHLQKLPQGHPVLPGNLAEGFPLHHRMEYGRFRRDRARPANRFRPLNEKGRLPARLHQEKPHDGPGDRIGQFLLKGRASEQFFLLQVRDVGRFDQDRRNFRHLQHPERRFLDPVELQLTDIAQFPQNIHAERFGDVDRIRLAHIDQNGVGFFLHIGFPGTADDVRQVFVLRQDFRRHTGRLTRRQAVHGTAPGFPVSRRVGMNADEHVRAEFPGDLQSFIERNVIIAVPRQVGLEKTMAVEVVFQPPADRQNDILLIGSVFSDRAGVIAAMAGIDDNDLLVRRDLDLLAHPALPPAYFRKLDVDHQAVRFIHKLLQGKDIGLHIVCHLQANQGIPFLRGGNRQLPDPRLVKLRFPGRCLTPGHIPERDGQNAILTGSGENGRIGQIENNPGMIRRRPVAHVRDDPRRAGQVFRAQNHKGKDDQDTVSRYLAYHACLLANHAGSCKKD